MDIAGFLRRYPPFDELDDDGLARLARSVEIEHFPADTVILQQGGDPAQALYVVRKGAVELLDDGMLLDQLVEIALARHPDSVPGGRSLNTAG